MKLLYPMFLISKLNSHRCNVLKKYEFYFDKKCTLVNIANHIRTSCSNSKSYKITELNTNNFSKEIATAENEEKLHVLVNEVQSLVKKKSSLPTFINDDQLYELFILHSRTQRLKYLHFLFKKEKLKIADEEKKTKKKMERLQRHETIPDEQDSQHLAYGLKQNTLLLSLRSPSLHRFYQKRLLNSVLFGNKLVIDMSYDAFMIQKEKKAAAHQLAIIYSTNRKDQDPFDLYFCNAVPTYSSVSYLKKYIPGIEGSLTTVSEESYLNMFPRDKLVYLSPHASQTLKEYDPSAVYVIGAFVDTARKNHLSADKAEKEGIKSISLPLDQHVMWGCGTKSLTINQVFEIMLILKNTGDWKKAFNCIPSRKIKKLQPEEVEVAELYNKIYIKSQSG